MTGFPEDPRCRADENERSVAGLLHLAQESACNEERRREVRAQSLIPALERELPHRDVLSWPDTLHRDAYIDAAEDSPRFPEEPVDIRIVGEVGLDDGRSA